MNTLGIRQIVPTGPHEFIMKWTMFGFEGDDEEMTRHRLRQGNLMGPAGFLGLEDNEAIKFVQDGMQRVPDRRHLVKLDPETAAGTADTLIPMVQAVKSKWIGINLDSGNFRTDDPYTDFERCVPYALNVQFKTEIGKGTPGGVREADMKRFTKILKEQGYQGWVALEYEAKEDPWTAVPRLLAELRQILSA